MKFSFKAGDRVQLRTGGRIMSVEVDIDSDDPGAYVACKWRSPKRRDTVVHEQFEVDQLVKLPPRGLGVAAVRPPR